MAYALVSFIHILKQYEHDHVLTPDSRHQIKSLLDKACRLRNFVEDSYRSGRTRDLEDTIRDATHMAEDIIEIGFTDQFSEQSPHFLSLESALRAFDSINHQVSISDWELCRRKVFGQECCPPPELESIGTKIAQGCGSLPVASTLVAGLLSMSEPTRRFWELAKRMVNTPNPLLDSVLLMCYDYLPYHLKPCFLYLGAFPVDYEIRASKIISLWIAEGFVASAHDNILEETAERHLADLVGRNLVVVTDKETNGKVKAFQLQDSVREFCRKKAREEKLLWFQCSGGSNTNTPEEKETTRRVSFDPLAESTDNLTSMPLARSFLCLGHASVHLAPMFFAMRLLRVLDVFHLEFHRFPKEILELVLLRYLAFSCHSDLPSSIAKLRYLQSLIIRRLPSCRAFSLPPALWNSTELRHIKSKETCIWFFPRDEESFFLENLQTLSNIQAFLLTQKFLSGIKNIRKLGIFFNESSRTLLDLSSLLKLQTLKCSSSLSDMSRDLLLRLSFPPLLKKLTLSSCKIPGVLMRVVGSLSHLEQLKLQKCDLLGIELNSVSDDCSDSESEVMEPEWSLVEGEFPQLRSLVMEELDLVHWKANQTHFPSLERLVIRRCYSMRGIPLDIGYINTLEVDESNPSVLDSAQMIRRDGVQAIGRGVVKLHVLDRRHTDVNLPNSTTHAAALHSFLAKPADRTANSIITEGLNIPPLKLNHSFAPKEIDPRNH